MRPATHGESSSHSPNGSHPSECENGPTSVNPHDRWYYGAYPAADDIGIDYLDILGQAILAIQCQIEKGAAIPLDVQERPSLGFLSRNGLRRASAVESRMITPGATNTCIQNKTTGTDPTRMLEIYENAIPANAVSAPFSTPSRSPTQLT
jgi:hypothetical protein